MSVQGPGVMAERKPRFAVDARLVLDMESLVFPKGEAVAAAVNPAWARIIADALNRTTQ